MKTVRKITALILTLATCLSMASCALWGSDSDAAVNSEYAEIISIKAADSEDGLITPDTSFCVSVKGKTTEEKLRNTLVFEPDIEYTIEKKSGNNYIITPSEKLEDSSLIRVKAMDSSKVADEWAFQTDGSLRVISHNPYGMADNEDGIEITMSSVDVSNFEECFSITPDAAGVFRQNGRTYIFDPGRLEDETEYTVTISKDLTDSSGETLGSDYTFSFFVSENRNVEVVYNNEHTHDAFRTDETPKANLRLDDCGEIDYKISAETYKIDDGTFEELISHYYYEDSVKPDVTGLKPVMTFEPELKDNYDVYKTAEYPGTLPEGKYVTIFTDDSGCKDFQVFEVSSYVVYLLSSDNMLTAWVHNSEGSPVSGCNVKFAGKSAETDKNGIAEIDYTGAELKDGEYGYISQLPVYIGDEGNAFITYPEAYTSVNNRYYSYIYASSTLYRPGDTVELWGFVVPSAGAEIPDEIELTYDYCNKTAKITPDENGSFTFSFVTDAPSGSSYILNTMSVDGERMASCYFDVSEYDLPEMQIEVSTDKKAYFIGEKVNIDITAKSFDGTPMADMPLDINIGDGSVEKTLNTDSSGKVSYTLDTSSLRRRSSSLYEWNEITVSSGDEETSENSSQSVSFYVFYSDTGISDSYYDEEYIDNEDPYAAAYNVDLTGMNKSGDYADYEGTHASVTAELTVTEEYSVETLVGSEYNYLTGKTENEYNYETVSEVRSKETVTLDNTYALDYDKYAEKDGYLEFSFKINTLGTDVVETCYAYSHAIYGVTKEVEEITLHSDKKSYNIGDTVNITAENAGTVKSAIFINSFINKQKVTVTSGASTSFTFDENYKNGTVVYAAFFDGKQITGDAEIVLASDYDFDAMVTVKADKDEYKPGDTVKLDIYTADSSGNPVSAVVNVNVVDSALLAVSPNPVTTEEIYPDVRYGSGYTYFSSWKEYVGPYEGGGGGGDGADTIRSDFEDTPYFGVVETGKDGRATAEFTLPDSVTTWDITATAICQDGKSGYAKGSVRGTIDYFMIVSGTDVFCSKDDIVTAVRCTSDVLDEGKNSITASLLSSDGKTVKTVKSEAELNEYAQFNFGKVSEGSYKIKIKASCGDYSDAVLKNITVRNTKVTSYVTETSEIGENTKLDADTDYITTVRLMDSSYSAYKSVYEKVMAFEGDDFDVTLAKDYMTDWYEGREYSTGGAYSGITEDGYWYDYSDGERNTGADLEMTAMYAVVFPGSVMSEEGTFRSATDKSDFNNILIYAILGSENEPVLKALSAYKEKEKFSTLAAQEQVWLGLAYAAAGDLDSAREVYEMLDDDLSLDENRQIKRKFTSAYGGEEMTNLLALLSFCISSDDGQDRLEGILQKDYGRTQPTFALMAYVEKYYRGRSSVDKVTVDMNGEKSEISFPGTDDYILIVNPEDMANTTFTATQGSVTAVYSCYRHLGEIKASGSDSFTVDSYVSEDTVSVGDTFIMEYIVTPDSDKDTVTLDLVVPAGVQIIDFCDVKINGNDSDNYGYGTMLKDNRTCHFTMYNGEIYDIQIKCAASFAGDFTFEPAVAVNSALSSTAVSGECNIKIANAAE